MKYWQPRACIAWTIVLCMILAAGVAVAADHRFVNFESPVVHPLDLSPNATLLAACNSADATVDLFSVASGVPTLLRRIPVGLDPATARFRTDNELWVVNWLSDSVSVVDVAAGTVTRTLQTRDEPADVVFANGRAFVSCSQANALLVFDQNDLGAAPAVLRIAGKFPRALAVSADSHEVYVAIFQSGNRSTLLAHDFQDEDLHDIIPAHVVSLPEGPHGGQNPPFNGNGQFNPPLAPGLPPPPPTDLIVKQDAGGAWRDDTAADWSRFVGGADSTESGRVPGWHLADNDLAVIATDTLAVSYVPNLMNICAALAVQPGTGRIAVAGTDAINEVRYEPNVRGRFVRAVAAIADPHNAATPTIADLNARHLDYTTGQLPAAQRARSIGEPRAIAWDAEGTQAWVAGLGSNNLLSIDAAGNSTEPIALSAGPVGLAPDTARGRLYVLCRFAATIDVVDTTTNGIVASTPLYDPTPTAIREGRPVLYDTIATSGLGQAACASCHVDARTDGLAWDLGDPQGSIKSSATRNIVYKIPQSAADNYHPMKGPRTTQTLQDIIGHEPFHWSGDRDGLEAFSGAFATLLGGDVPLPEAPMARLKRYLATINFPPNPYRNLDNSLPTEVDLSDQLGPAPIGQPRAPLPAGDAVHGLAVYLTSGAGCAECHTLPSGRGTPLHLDSYNFEPIADGPHGERHLRVVTGANTAIQTTYKMPPLAPVYEKGGLDYLSADGSTSGFGFFSTGGIDSVLRFALAVAPVRGNLSFQDCVDLYALLLSWGGSDLPVAPNGTLAEPPGLASRDSHAAVGKQVTIHTPADDLTRLATLRNAVDRSSRIELIAKGHRGGALHGWWYGGNGEFLGDTPAESTTLSALVASSGPGAETTFTVVAAGTGKRLGIDRDLDGTLDAVDATLDPVVLDAGDASDTDQNCPTCAVSDLTLREGDTLCLHVDAPGATAFQWSRDTTTYADSPRVQGAFCDRLQISSVSEEDAGIYRVDYVDSAKSLQHGYFTVTVRVAGLPAHTGAGLLLLCVGIAVCAAARRVHIARLAR